jgi:primosomal protein N'
VRHLVRQLFFGRNGEKVAFFAGQFAKAALERLGTVHEVRGPAPAPVEKAQDMYRHQIWYFTSRPLAVATALRELGENLPWPEDVRQVVDVDPVSLL